mmetsp:Transcript_41136/g.132335  ORF Transcript_41136/g.132335 Transcript_41136/m.132335 type:complete len:483 (-) Transcript_41136:2150-3598(-)
MVPPSASPEVGKAFRRQHVRVRAHEHQRERLRQELEAAQGTCECAQVVAPTLDAVVRRVDHGTTARGPLLCRLVEVLADPGLCEVRRVVRTTGQVDEEGDVVVEVFDRQRLTTHAKVHRLNGILLHGAALRLERLPHRPTRDRREVRGRCQGRRGGGTRVTEGVRRPDGVMHPNVAAVRARRRGRRQAPRRLGEEGRGEGGQVEAPDGARGLGEGARRLFLHLHRQGAKDLDNHTHGHGLKHRVADGGCGAAQLGAERLLLRLFSLRCRRALRGGHVAGAGAGGARAGDGGEQGAHGADERGGGVRVEAGSQTSRRAGEAEHERGGLLRHGHAHGRCLAAAARRLALQGGAQDARQGLRRGGDSLRRGVREGTAIEDVVHHRLREGIRCTSAVGTRARDCRHGGESGEGVPTHCHTAQCILQSTLAWRCRGHHHLCLPRRTGNGAKGVHGLSLACDGADPSEEKVAHLRLLGPRAQCVPRYS